MASEKRPASELSWTRQLRTPCFVFYEDAFLEDWHDFQEALSQQFPSAKLAYSVKTNALPYILQTILEHDGIAEVVSYDEFHLVRRIGFPVNRIVYNGPMKDRDTFYEALAGGAYIHIETNREIDWLREYHGPKCGHIGVRLNLDLGLISPEDAKEGESDSRFGFSYESGDFQRVIREIEAMGFSVTGIHAHRTSKTRSKEVYGRVCAYVTKIVRELQLHIDTIDLGGGFYGKMPGKVTFAEYAKVIRDNLPLKENQTLIIEPGNALIARPMDYCTTIFDTKQIGETKICACDGSRIDIDPFFHKERYLYTVIPKHENESRSEIGGGWLREVYPDGMHLSGV